jgi:hypothetical protein
VIAFLSKLSLSSRQFLDNRGMKMIDNGVPAHALSRLRLDYLDDENNTIVFELNDPASGDTHSAAFTADKLENYISSLTAQDPQADVWELQYGLNVYRNLCEGELVKAKKIVFQHDPEQASADCLLNLKLEYCYALPSPPSALLRDGSRGISVELSENKLRDAVAAAREEGYELPRFQEVLHKIAQHKPTALPVKFAKFATQVAVSALVITNGIGIAGVALDNRLTESNYRSDKLRADPSNPQLLVHQERREVLSGPLPQQVGQSTEVVDLKSQSVSRITRQDGTQPKHDHTASVLTRVYFGLVNQAEYKQETISQMPESSQKVAVAMASFNRVAKNGGSTDVTELNQALQAQWQAKQKVATLMPN